MATITQVPLRTGVTRFEVDGKLVAAHHPVGSWVQFPGFSAEGDYTIEEIQELLEEEFS